MGKGYSARAADNKGFLPSMPRTRPPRLPSIGDSVQAVPRAYRRSKLVLQPDASHGPPIPIPFESEMRIRQSGDRVKSGLQSLEET